MGELRDKGVAAVVDDFMSKPIGPSSIERDGKKIPERYTPSGSSREYVGSLSVDERFALLREAVDEGQLLAEDDMFMMGHSGDIDSFSDLVSRACTDLLRAGAEMIPEVLERDDEQGRVFDAIFDPEPEA